MRLAGDTKEAGAGGRWHPRTGAVRLLALGDDEPADALAESAARCCAPSPAWWASDLGARHTTGCPTGSSCGGLDQGGATRSSSISRHAERGDDTARICRTESTRSRSNELMRWHPVPSADTFGGSWYGGESPRSGRSGPRTRLAARRSVDARRICIIAIRWRDRSVDLLCGTATVQRGVMIAALEPASARALEASPSGHFMRGRRLVSSAAVRAAPMLPPPFR